jgi:5-methylcytosine-specific restriction endonuclease McrA
MDTLILNKDGNPLSLVPLSVVSWQVAIRLLSLGKVTVLKEHEDWIVRSQKLEMHVPSIVICTEYVKWNKRIKYSRTNVYLRDDFTCQLQSTTRCRENHGKVKISDLTLDHVVPRSKGGKTNWTNVITSCKECNSNKGNDHTIVPKKMPYKPTYYEILAKRKNHPVQVRDPEWAYYLGDWKPELIRVSQPKQNHHDNNGEETDDHRKERKGKKD